MTVIELRVLFAEVLPVVAGQDVWIKGGRGHIDAVVTRERPTTATLINIDLAVVK